jgi:hypothetical protein
MGEIENPSVLRSANVSTLLNPSSVSRELKSKGTVARLLKSKETVSRLPLTCC